MPSSSSKKQQIINIEISNDIEAEVNNDANLQALYGSASAGLKQSRNAKKAIAKSTGQLVTNPAAQLS